jgi:D-methionine transport system substrate-binding protein
MPLPLLPPRRFSFHRRGQVWFGAEPDQTSLPFRKKLPLREIDAAQLPRGLADLDAAVINTNYAVPAGLIPGKDSIAIESTVNNPYNNFVAVRERDEDAPWVPKLVRAYQNDTIRQLIKDKLPGQLPAL